MDWSFYGNHFCTTMAGKCSGKSVGKHLQKPVCPTSFGGHGCGKMDRWLLGHWADVSKDTMAMNMLHIYEYDTLSHGFLNFEIVAGHKEGRHRGAPFHDGDFYKTLETLVSDYASTKNQRYYNELERIIKVIADAQRAHGYIHTSTIIKQRNNPEDAVEFEDRMNFETY